jgi:hypothetical protein
MQDLFYNITSSSLFVTSERGYSYTISNVTVQVKPDTGSFVAVSSSVDVAFFPISNTNLFYKPLELDTPISDQTAPLPSSFYWTLNIDSSFPTTSSNYLLITSSLQTYVSQSAIGNSGMFNVTSGSALNVKANSDHLGGYDFDASIIDKTDNYTVLSQSYTTPLVFTFTPTSSHYYEINLNITSNL